MFNWRYFLIETLIVTVTTCTLIEWTVYRRFEQRRDKYMEALLASSICAATLLLLFVVLYYSLGHNGYVPVKDLPS